MVELLGDLQTDICGIILAGSVGVLTHRHGDGDDLVSVAFKDGPECWVPKNLLVELMENEHTTEVSCGRV